MARFLLQKFVMLNMILASFLVEKWGTLERARRYVYKNLNLDYHVSVHFDIFKLLKNEESFGKSFFLFSAKCFNRNCNFLFQKILNFLSCILLFLNIMKFRRLKTN